jgi:hypothetical protein
MAARTQLFDRYAANLSAVKAHPRIHLEPDLDDIVMCPQCFKVITRDNLDDAESEFSLEHVPPEALGGRIRTFTCRECNSSAGHDLDSHLLNWLHLRDFLQAKPGSTVDARVTIAEKAQLIAELVYTQDGILQILADRNRTNPDQLEHANRLMRQGPPEINLNFSGRKGRGAKLRRPEAALLRIAYLYTFSVFGYGFLINAGSQAIRRQFRNPDDKILPAWGISHDDRLPDEVLGINIVTSPGELRSYAVGFDLVYDSNRMRYSVLIPGPTAPSTDVYAFLAGRTDHPTPINMKLVPISLEYDYIGEASAAFAFHDYWKYYNR